MVTLLIAYNLLCVFYYTILIYWKAYKDKKNIEKSDSFIATAYIEYPF